MPDGHTPRTQTAFLHGVWRLRAHAAPHELRRFWDTGNTRNTATQSKHKSPKFVLKWVWKDILKVLLTVGTYCMWFGVTVHLHHMNCQVFLVHKLFRTCWTLQNVTKTFFIFTSGLWHTQLRFLLGVCCTLWGISPVWVTVCNRSASFVLNVVEQMRQVYVWNYKSKNTEDSS